MVNNEFKTTIDNRLEALFSSELSRAKGKEARLLISRISKVCLRTGKRFRPILFDKIYSAYGGQNDEQRIDIGVSLELFHQALLFHDDVIDQDIVRNGVPNIIGIYQADNTYAASNIPQSMAILAGDYLISLVNKVITSSNAISDSKLKILDLIHECFSEVIFGQQLDTLNAQNLKPDLGFEDIVSINIHKTACYTTILPIILAVCLLDLNADEIILLEEMGNDLGIYYQLVNDLKDYFGTSAEFRDYSSGKVTFPYLTATSILSGTDAEFLKLHFSKQSLTKQEIIKLKEILLKNAVDKECIAQADKYYRSALSELRLLSITEESKLELIKLFENIKIEYNNR